MGFFDAIGSSFGDDSGLGGMLSNGLEVLELVGKGKAAIDAIQGNAPGPAPAAKAALVPYQDPALKKPKGGANTSGLLVVGVVGLVVLFIVMRR